MVGMGAFPGDFLDPVGLKVLGVEPSMKNILQFKTGFQEKRG